MKRLTLIFLPFLLIGCMTTQQEYIRHGFTKGISLPTHPVIFVPGLGYTGKFWEKSHVIRELRRLKWQYGGELRIIEIEGKFSVFPGRIRPAHIYTITFSSSQLAIQRQGRQLAEVINHVKDANHTDKVILIGHSMGGLASREYLQSSYYRGDVSTFISVGTPHRGSSYNLQKISLKLVPKLVRNLVWKVDEQGDAVRDLRPGSVFFDGGPESRSPDEYRSKDINLNGSEDILVGLNDFKARPLPEDVRYVSVIGCGCPLVSTRTQCLFSDGIVQRNSQDLNMIPGVNVRAEVLVTNKDHLGEVNDSWILMRALEPQLACPKAK